VLLVHTAADLLGRHWQDVARGPVAPAGRVTDDVRDWLAGYDFGHSADGDEVLNDVLARFVDGEYTTHPRYFGLFNLTSTWWG
jgi:hypothetical protein